MVVICFSSLNPQERAPHTLGQLCLPGLIKGTSGLPSQLGLTSFVEDGHYDLVKQYSAQYGVDYRLILAIIKQESQFNQDALSERGAEGFMQIMPVTNAELTDELELPEQDFPRENLQAGIYYFSTLLELFNSAPVEDCISLALAAYNAGPARIYDAQDLAAYIGENPQRWSSLRHVLPLLSKRYYSLHHEVWHSGKPKNGFFGSSRQTVDYVETVLKSYRMFQTHA